MSGVGPALVGEPADQERRRGSAEPRTVGLACTQDIRSLRIETPGTTVGTCTDTGRACAIEHGSDVTAQAGESRPPSVTVKWPALADGEEVIIEIRGDSTDYIVDEVM